LLLLLGSRIWHRNQSDDATFEEATFEEAIYDAEHPVMRGIT
jgi:hypothetical protein